MTTALVTGAARGLGLEVARRLAASGIHVVVAARDPDQAAAAAADIDGVEGLRVGLDIGDPESVAAAAAAVSATTGELDVLVNNAAAHPDLAETVPDADLVQSADAFQVTLFGTWRMTQAFLPLLRRSPHPRIVNVGSGAGSHADEQHGMPVMGGAFPTHAVSKAAVHAFTAVLAAELADTPIIVNAVCPGVTATSTGAVPPGARPVSEGAAGVVWAATLPDDGPRGGFFRDGLPLGW